MVRFILHASRRLAQRGITQESISYAFANPIETIQAKRNRIAIYSQVNERYLLVIFEKLNNEELVITAMWSDRKRLRRFGFARV
jgi:hypothetical protein